MSKKNSVKTFSNPWKIGCATVLCLLGLMVNVRAGGSVIGDVRVVSTSYDTTIKSNVFTYIPPSKTDQTITFPAIGNKLITDIVGLAATASSGLPVSFSVASGPALISGGTNLSFSGAGTVSVVASQSGNSSYNAAPSVTNIVNVCELSASEGPYAGGNTVTFTNGNFGIITNVLVNGVVATIIESGTSWFTITMPSIGATGMVDVAVQTSDNGETVLADAYAYNPAGEIGGTAYGPYSWTNLGSGVNSAGGNYVQDLVCDGTRLYAGGNFTNMGGVTTAYVAMWDPASGTWTNLDSGMNGLVCSLAHNGTNLYAGGKFSVAGGATAIYVAMWDGTTWTNLGGGPASACWALAFGGTNLYCGNDKRNTSPQNIAGVSTWDGTTWTNSRAWPYNVANLMFDVEYVGGTLYAGGNFKMLGGVAVTNLAMRNPADTGTWASMGGANDYVYTLAQDGTNLYAGGMFTNVAGVDASLIAMWNGSNWTNLGSGVQGGRVYKALHDGRNLYVAGTFTNAGGVALNNIAMWNGSSWTNVGDLGTNVVVYALAHDGVNLYAGGTFTNVGNVAASCVAKWGPEIVESSGVSPESGSGAGGYPVVITGTNLGNGADITNVTICGAAVWAIVSQSATQVVVTTGTALSGGLGDVRVYSTSYGETVKNNAFTYIPPSKTDQTITFPTLGNKLTTDTVGLSATASSGLPVSFSVASGPALISGGTNLTFSAVGSVSIVASQSGNSSYNAAPNVTNSFTVTDQPVYTIVTNLWQDFETSWTPGTTNETKPGISTNSVPQGGFPDTGWSKAIISNSMNWIQATNGINGNPRSARTNAWVNPDTGTSNCFARFGAASYGNVTRLFTPPLDLSNAHSVTMSFWHIQMPWPADQDILRVRVTTNFSWAIATNQAGTLYNGSPDTPGWHTLANFTAAQTSWVERVFTVASSNFGPSTVFCFEGIGEYAYGTCIDDLKIISMTEGDSAPSVVLVDTLDSPSPAQINKSSGASATFDGVWFDLVGATAVVESVSLSLKSNTSPGNWWVAGLFSSPLTNNAPTTFVANLGTLITTDTVNFTKTTFTPSSPVSLAGNLRYWVVYGSITSGQQGAYQQVTVATNSAAVPYVTVFESSATSTGKVGRWRSTSQNTLDVTDLSGITLTGGTTSTSVVPIFLVTGGVGVLAGPEDQTIGSFLPASGSSFAVSDVVRLSAIASSGLPVSFSVASGAASISDGSNLTFSAAGSVSIVASQSGNSSYNAAPDVTNTVYVCALTANAGPYAGGNSITITNGSFGTITNVTVGGVQATVTEQGATWVTITLPAIGSAGTKDIVIQTSDNGTTTLTGAYTVNPAGRIADSGLVRGGPYIAGVYGHSLGLKSDGTIVAWGWNYYGQTTVLAPNTNFVAVAAGTAHSLGLKSDGTIVAWGWNYYGQTTVPAPNTNFVAVAAGGAHSLGLKSDGTIVAWGWNNFGQTNVPAPNASFVAVAAGETHSLGLKSDGTIVAWGDNTYGQTNVPAPNTNFVAVAAGVGHSLGLKSDGTIVAWGNNGSGQTNVPAPNTNFVAVSGGASHSLGLKSDGTIVAWGDNLDGETTVPAPNTNFVAVSGGASYSLGLKSDGTIVAWGSNYYGQTNVPAPNASFGKFTYGVSPSSGSVTGGYSVVISGTNLGNGSDVTDVTLCGVSVASITSQSSTQIVVVAGVTGVSVTGDVRVVSTSFGETIKSNAFTYTAPGLQVWCSKGDVVTNGAAPSMNASTRFMQTRLGLSWTNTFRITNSGTEHVTISGVGLSGSRFAVSGLPSAVAAGGVSNFSVSYTPTQPGDDVAVLSISNDSPSSVYVMNFAGSCFAPSVNAGPLAGGNTLTITNGHFGTVTNVYLFLGEDPSDAPIVPIAAGSNWFTILVPPSTNAGLANMYIQTAEGDTIPLVFAYTYNPAGRIADPTLKPGGPYIAGGSYHSLGLKSDGTITAWGQNGFGETAVPAPNTNFVAVSAGRFYSLGLKLDGTITAWGDNVAGQTNVPAPNSDFVAVAAGSRHALGLKSDGTITAWGENTMGQANVPAPNTNFVVVAAGGFHSLGLKSDGTITAWGENSDNQTAVPAPNSDFVAVAGGFAHSLGLKTDGTIVAWGRNNHGQATAPAPNSNFVAVSAGSDHSLGLKSDGTIVAWGRNNYGQTNVPSPNADFVAVAAGYYHSLGLKSDGTIVAWGLNTDGQATVPAPNANFGKFEYGVSPSSGSVTGGYSVVISGTNLGNGSDVTGVTLCGVSVASITSQSSTQIVVVAGVTGVSVTGDVRVVSTSYGTTVKSNAFIYAKDNQTITFPAIAGQLTTNHLGLSATASSGLPVSFSVLSGSASISGSTNLTFSGTGVVSIVASQSGDTSRNAAPDVTNTFTVTKAVALVSLSNTNQTYDGSAKSVTVATVPTNRTFTVTYDGSATAPTNAGNYTVIGTVSDTMYQGGVTGTLVIAKADQTITFINPGDQLTTNKLGLRATASSGLAVTDFSVVSGSASIAGGTNLTFSGAGGVTISAAQTGNTNWNPATTSNVTFNVTKATASVSLSGTNQTYNGAARIVTATTVPAGLTVDVTYNGSSVAPTNAGSYTVSGIVNDAMYQGGTTGTLTVAKASQTVNFPNIGNQITTNVVTLSATASSGLSVTNFSVVSGPAAVSGNTVSFSAGGTVVLSASQDGNVNWNPASTNISFTVSTVSGLVTYADDAKADDGGDGLSWATAKKTIQAAIDLVGDGGNVWVTNGTYSSGTVVSPRYTMTNRVCITRNITVQSVNGAAVTIIDGGGSVHCAYLNNGTLSGFTLTNGVTATSGDWHNQCGGGAFLDYGGTLNNCTLSGSVARKHGGGVFLDSGGTLNNCTLNGNIASQQGGGVHLLYGGTLNNCTLSGNSATQIGGGAYFENGGTLSSCTLSGNSAGESGGGACLNGSGTLNNCIVWGNAGSDIRNAIVGTIRNTCASDGVTNGVNGCITSNPLFVSTNDFHLLPGSPCINAGNNSYVTTTNDLAGNPRIAFGTVDMGAYESQIPPITVPVALSAVDITSSQFTARWEATDNATNYLIDVSESTNFTAMTGIYSNWSAGNATACLVTGLTDGVTYWYRVRAANQYGTSLDSNIIEVPVSTNTPYVKYEVTNGVASAGSSDVVDMTKLFHGTGMRYSVVSNSNPALVAVSFRGSDLILDYASGVAGTAQITIQATDNSTGFQVESTFTVSVVAEPSLTAGPITLNRQNGLYEQTVTVSNTSPLLAARAVTLTVTNLSAGASLYNATGTDEHGNPEIQWAGTLAPLGSMDFTLQYYTSTRGTVPSATVLASLSLEEPATDIIGTALSLSARYENIGGTDSFLIEFAAVPGRTYYIQYTSSLQGEWKTAHPAIVAPVNRIQWIDSGPPGTECAPGEAPTRFYRVIEVTE